MTSARTPLLGREHIVAAAWAALHPHAGVLLTGPEGIGRSAVLEHLAVRAAAAGARVLRCAPTPADSAAPYAALVDLLRPLPGNLLPRALGQALDDPRQAEPFAVHRALAAVLADLSRDAPLLLAVDDLQHLDEASAASLAHLAHRAASLRLTLAATARTGPQQGFGRDELLPPRALQIELPPLAEEFVRALLPEPSRRLLALAAGRPGHARALARHPAEAPDELPATLRKRQLAPVRPLPPTTRQALLLTAHAAAPTLELLRAAGVDDPVAALAPALGAGLASVAADGRVQLAAPVLAAALRDDADHARTLAAHEALAQAHPADTLSHARHLALARPWGDESL
ncbi:AAA family ATPase, partial [Streptacidiphilus monticola]